MDASHLVRMVNQIADFFKSYPEEEAIRETVNHIQKFWDPRMRKQMREYLDGGGKGLQDLAARAARQACAERS
jgi:formate dehydrogenase subunit delta